MNKPHRPLLLRLNLGCGNEHLAGFINTDIDPNCKPDKIIDLRKKLPFKTGVVKEILLQDVLEHLTKEDGRKLLQECSRILSPRGILKVRVPNPRAILQKFRWQEDLLMLYLYGDTSKNGEWGAHKYGYTPRLWQEILEDLGLESRNITAIDTNYLFEAKKPVVALDKYQVHCHNIIEYLQTPWHYLRGRTIIWHMTKQHPAVFSKLVLRPLSLLVNKIEVTDVQLQKYTTSVLKFSHLRMYQKLD